MPPNTFNVKYFLFGLTAEPKNSSIQAKVALNMALNVYGK
jgi:hypothetical protein